MATRPAWARILDQVKIITPAGSVISFNATDLRHCGTFNYTPAARLALTVHFHPG